MEKELNRRRKGSIQNIPRMKNDTGEINNRSKNRIKKVSKNKDIKKDKKKK